MLSSLLKFTSIMSTSIHLLTNPGAYYFSTDTYTSYETYVGSSCELSTPFDVPSTYGDDVSTVFPSPPTNELPRRVRNPLTYLFYYD